MTPIQALFLGLIQGLTEFLPVSSSGHLEIGKALFGLDLSGKETTFDVVVHAWYSVESNDCCIPQRHWPNHKWPIEI